MARRSLCEMCSEADRMNTCQHRPVSTRRHHPKGELSVRTIAILRMQ
jgi:hypothetical protein